MASGSPSVGRWIRTHLGDVGLVALYCRWLKYELVDLYLAEQAVRTLLKDERVHEATKAVGSELLEHGAIPGSRVSELVAEAGVGPAVVDRALLPLGGRGGPEIRATSGNLRRPGL